MTNIAWQTKYTNNICAHIANMIYLCMVQTIDYLIQINAEIPYRQLKHLTSSRHIETYLKRASS